MSKKLPQTVEIYFDGEKVETLVQDKGEEILCTAKDGRFVKFPSTGDFAALVKAHNRANDNVPDAPDEEADRQAAELAAWRNS